MERTMNRVEDTLMVKKELIENHDINLFAHLNEGCERYILDHTYSVLTKMIANMLSFIKSKDHPTVAILRNNNNEIILAGKVEYHKNENEEMPGNWSLVFTYDPEVKNVRIMELNRNNEFMNTLINTIITDAEENEKLDILLKYLTRVLLKDVNTYLIDLFERCQKDINNIIISNYNTQIEIEDDLIHVSFTNISFSLFEYKLFPLVSPWVKQLIKDDAMLEE